MKFAKIPSRRSSCNWHRRKVSSLDFIWLVRTMLDLMHILYGGLAILSASGFKRILSRQQNYQPVEKTLDKFNLLNQSSEQGVDVKVFWSVSIQTTLKDRYLFAVLLFFFLILHTWIFKNNTLPFSIMYTRLWHIMVSLRFSWNVYFRLKSCSPANWIFYQLPTHFKTRLSIHVEAELMRIQLKYGRDVWKEAC